MADDELGARMREGVVPHSVAGKVVAGRGEAGDKGRGWIAVAADRLVVSIVADVERVLAVAGDRGRTEPIELTAVKAGVDRGVLQVDTGDATVVVVHGDVEHATAHFH